MPNEDAVLDVRATVAVPVDAVPTSESRYAIAHDPASNTPILVRTVDGNVQAVTVLRAPREMLERFCEITRQRFVAKRNMAAGGNTNPEVLLAESLDDAMQTINAEYGTG